MAEEIKVKIGTKISDEDAKKLDPEKGAKGHPTPKGGGGVTGQALVTAAVVCPYCGAVNHCWVDTNFINWYTCWNCLGCFSA